MGEQARKFFEDAAALGGIAATVKLAALARITSTEARTVEDSAELLRRLTGAMQNLHVDPGIIASERSGAASLHQGEVLLAVSHSPDATNLRRYLQIYVELMSQRALFLATSEATIRRIDEASCTALDVERVSVWFLDPPMSKITCADLFQRRSREHTSGVELFAKDFSPYFKALTSERTIAANDACRDPRTSCFAESYLKPIGITSMLDVPIWVGSKMVGVLCHEHVGPKRKWNSDEEAFGYLMANFVALAIERHGPK